MHTSNSTIPYKIADYLHEHFPGAHLTNVKKIRDAQQRSFFIAEIEYSGMVHWLKFDENGFLTDKESGPAYHYERDEDIFSEAGDFSNDARDL